MSHTPLHWIWAGLGDQQRMTPSVEPVTGSLAAPTLVSMNVLLGSPSHLVTKCEYSGIAMLGGIAMLSLWRGFWERDPEKEMVAGREKVGGEKDRENGQVHRHTQLFPALPAMPAPSQTWKWRIYLSHPSSCPVDDSTLIAIWLQAWWILMWEMPSQAQLTHKTMKII